MSHKEFKKVEKGGESLIERIKAGNIDEKWIIAATMFMMFFPILMTFIVPFLVKR